MKFNRTNANKIGKYFAMVMVALIVYKMIAPRVEGWKLRDQNYECRKLKTSMLPKIRNFPKTRKSYNVCRDGIYEIINGIGPDKKPYETLLNQAVPSGCRGTCGKKDECSGFVYDKSRKTCEFYNTGNINDGTEKLVFKPRTTYFTKY